MKSKYKSIIVKESLHQELDEVCRKKGFRTTTELLNYFLKMEYEMNERMTNELFNDGEEFNPYRQNFLNEQYNKNRNNQEEFNPYHNLNEQYKNRNNETK
jgi:hypothetical protein